MSRGRRQCGVRNMPNWYKRTKGKMGVREKYLRIFVLECPDPLDALQGRSEGPVMAAIGKLIGHEVLTFLVRSKRELQETCQYVSSIDPHHDAQCEPDRPLCLHISAHGNANGLALGADFVAWQELAEAIQAFLSSTMAYKGKRIVVLSACQADQQQLSSAIKELVAHKKAVSPPKYLFCTSGDVPWQNAAVGWTLFYHLLPDVDLDRKEAVQEILSRIKLVGVGPFVYFRWDEAKRSYRKYAATEK